MGKQPGNNQPSHFGRRPGETPPAARVPLRGEGRSSLPGLSPASDDLPGRRGLSKTESVARILLQGIAILGISVTLAIVFLLLPVLLTFGSIFNPGHDAWPDMLPWLLGLLLLLGCIGLLLFRRWAAVLVCGLGWGWLVYICYVKVCSVGPTLFSDSSVPVVTAFLVGLPQVVTLLMTVSVIVYWRHLKNEL